VGVGSDGGRGRPAGETEYAEAARLIGGSGATGATEVQLGLRARVLAVIAEVLRQLQSHADAIDGDFFRRERLVIGILGGCFRGGFVKLFQQIAQTFLRDGPGAGNIQSLFQIIRGGLKLTIHDLTLNLLEKQPVVVPRMGYGCVGQRGAQRLAEGTIKRIAHDGQHPGKRPLGGIGCLGEIISLQ
jgi:hypothetical protein